MRRAIAIASVFIGLGVGAFAAADEPQTVQLVAETWSGDVFILGEGDTCRDAWTDHGPIPEDWRELRCDVINAGGIR